MATHVQDTLDDIDLAVSGYAQAVFTDFAGPITTTCQLMGLVGLAFLTFNALVQWSPIQVSEYIRWGARFVIITAVATSWAQFEPLYRIITEVPAELGGRLLSAAGISGASDLYSGIDNMISEIFAFSDEAAAQSGMFSVNLAGNMVWAVGVLMAVAAIIVAALGKVGLAMSVTLAPIFIPTLLFKATSNLFESWVRFTLGFALIPLVLAGVMGIVIGIGKGMISDVAEAGNLSEAAPFLIVGVAGIFLMAQVPTLVTSLAGTVVAAANGVRLGSQAGEAIGKGTKTAARRAQPQFAAASSATRAAISQPGGASKKVKAWETDYQQTKDAGKRGAENFSKRQAELGRQTTMSERATARGAARTEQARQHTRERKQGRRNNDDGDD